jgi:hypothetical protein
MSRDYVAKEWGSLVGASILKVRELTPSELDDFGWDSRGGAVPIVLHLSDGRAIVPSMDPEGNGPGHLFIEDLA